MPRDGARPRLDLAELGTMKVQFVPIPDWRGRKLFAVELTPETDNERQDLDAEFGPWRQYTGSASPVFETSNPRIHGRAVEKHGDADFKIRVFVQDMDWMLEG
jgi:hypothetical protein